MIAPETVLAACRFVFDGAAIFLWGSSAYLAAAVPERLSARIAGRLLRHQRLAVVLALAAIAVLLLAEAALIGDGWASAGDLTTLGDILSGTSIGLAWQAQATCGLALLVLSVVPIDRRQAALATISALLLATLSITGHAAVGSGWTGTLHRASHILHLLAGGGWLGALVPVLMLLPRLAEPEARLALMRFSTLGHVAVALVLATGLADMLYVLGGLPTGWSFPYQLLLSIKILLVLGMTLLAAVNRYVLVPRLARAGAGAVRALRWGALGEILLGVFVLGLVAWFGMLDPN